MTMPITSDPDPEAALALSYAPADRRGALAALLALDATLGGLVRAAREPLIAQMRLTWWHGALEALDGAPPPAQPVLAALAAEVMPRGVTGQALAAMVDGWEALLDPEPLDDARRALHAAERGARLFTLAGLALRANARDPLAAAGQGWALADVARNVSAPAERLATEASARPLLATALGGRWSRGGRALGAMARSAAMDLSAEPRPAGAPSRVARLLRMRLIGR